MCDKDHVRIPHICANGTSFNQEYRICDWDYNFVCDESDKWYYLNGLTYGEDDPTETEKEIIMSTTEENEPFDRNKLKNLENQLEFVQQASESNRIARAEDEIEPQFLIDIKK